MFAKPQSEHKWFNDLLGNWEFSHECDMGPDQPASKTSGKMAARSLGGLWILMECQGTSPEGDEWSSVFTLGYDPQKGQYLGTFVASMMTHLWVYEGQLDESGKKLVLNVEGPKCEGEGMAQYRDIFEIVSHDDWILHSQMLGEDGQWHEFMVGPHHRV